MQDPNDTSAGIASQPSYPDDARIVQQVIPSVCLVAATRGGAQNLATIMKGTRHAELVLWLFDSIYSILSTHGPFAVDFWPQIGLCCVLKSAYLLAARSGDAIPEGLESIYAEQWVQIARQPLHAMRPDLLLPFVSNIVETVQLPLQSAASTLQHLCRELSVLSRTDAEQPTALVDLFYLACMLLMAALRSDRTLAINPHLSGACLLAAASLIAQVEPSRMLSTAIRQVVGNDPALNDLCVMLLGTQFSTSLLTEAVKEPLPTQGALRLGAAAKRILLC